MLKNLPEDLKIETKKFPGIYRGVVESNIDELKMGRVQVRIFGLHTSSKTTTDIDGIPTADLPWAEPVLGLVEGSVSGFGLWSVPLQGSHVMIFFENENYTQPRYFATVPGIPDTAPDTSEGFNDPDGIYPRSDRLESDVHRLARGESTGTVIEYKNSNLESGISTALGGSWSEPASTYATTYPHSIVMATHGGIIVEADSTPGSKRVHIYHPSNTYVEVDNDGNVVIKSAGSQYEIIVGSHNIYVKQNRNLTVDGNMKNLTKGNVEREITGNETKQVGGNVDVDVTGNETEDVGGSVTRGITSDLNDTIGGSVTRDVTTDVDDTIGGNLTITVTGDVVISSANVDIGSGSQLPLLDSRAATTFKDHIHNVESADFGVTSKPTSDMDSDQTANTTAS